MQLPFLLENLKSNYCKIVFIIALVFGYLITPQSMRGGNLWFLTIIYISLFAFSIACMVRAIKEKISTTLTKSSSVISFITSVVGLSALQVCGLGAPMCGTSIGLSLLSAILPNFALQFLINHSLSIVLTAMLLQLIGLYSMKCFKTNHLQACDKNRNH